MTPNTAPRTLIRRPATSGECPGSQNWTLSEAAAAAIGTRHGLGEGNESVQHDDHTQSIIMWCR
jgi:hypothetical protein